MKYFILPLVTLIFTTTFASAGNYQINPAPKGIKFVVTKNTANEKKVFGPTSVEGTLKVSNGTFVFDEKTKTLSDFSVDIDMSSIDTGIEKRNTHLKSKDFFDVDNSKMAKFQSIKGQKTKINFGDGETAIPGTLTIKSTSKPVTLKVVAKMDPKKGIIIQSPKKGSLTIDRRAFNVKHNMKVTKGLLMKVIGKIEDSAKSFIGQNVIGNDVIISLDVQTTKI